MSTKVFCDRCGKEAKHGNLNVVPILCHLAEPDKMNCANGYVDSEGNPVSGRLVSFDLCNRCYNTVMSPVAKEILNPTKEKKNER